MPQYQLGISDDHARALGLIMFQFSSLELALLVCLIVALRDPRVAILLFHKLSFEQVRSLTLSICKVRKPDSRNEIEQVFGLIKEAAKKRNTAAHAVWGVAQNQEITRLALARGGNLFDAQAMSTPELEATAQFIVVARQKLMEFLPRLTSPTQ